MHRYLNTLCLAPLALGLAAPAAADFPEREVRLVVNYGAGGNTDVAARALAQGMEKALGQTVVVENRPGALGTLGPAYVARQKPDGYTVGVVTYSTIAIAPHLMDVPYGMDDFDFVSGFGRYRYGIAVRADAGYDSIDDLVAAAKEGKGVFFGAPSAPNNLALFELGRATGGRFEQILYKSGTETVTALLGGQVDVIAQNPSDILPHIQSGKLKLLASASPMRWPEAPDVPTLREAGYPVEIDSWLGVAVPRGTPADARERLQAAAIAAMENETVRKNFVSLGVDPATLSGQEYADVLREGYDTMGKAIEAAGLPRMQ
ncbi:tripartite tricarboxylate transporter substrate binding protein [Verticiella sediminum]|uniref:Tripartite tricarboxylate transporter substrate binding protein n=1 Tax=Verticiella sediminum TaxID=1247510 RepID=A0A556AXP1_9BURK|nr:tripartite tricarboxylate transporter substrate binding protein [Verticiella sediminum]TSH97666.1 tripartite tricarboxylate transporter substrate binding protein [Verticiella sediminum]